MKLQHTTMLATTKETGFFLAVDEKQVYGVLATPHDDHPAGKQPAITVMARIVNSLVIIDEDITDRPLYLELMRCGIPREQIILKYAGEKVPETVVPEGK